MERKDRDNPVIAELKKLGAVNLKLTLADGTERTAQVAKAGNKWDKLEKLLSSVDWHIAEAFDKEGNLLGKVEAPLTDGEAADLDYGDGDDPELASRIAKVMLEVMRGTMRETRLGYQATLDGQAKLVESMVEGMRAMSDAYATALRVQAAHQLAGDSEKSPEMMQMLGMALQLGNMGGLLGGGAKPPIQVKP